MERLTKQQFRERYTNIKVYVNGKSKELQEQFFRAGIDWFDENETIQRTDAPFLYISTPTRDKISHGFDMQVFTKSPERQVTAEEILNIEITEGEPECPFKPFDKVVARQTSKDVWNIDYFGYYDKRADNPYVAAGGYRYKECLPFNEQTAKLIGTTEDYKEDEE